ncbi:MAG TPA: cupin domain-containing protein [Gammaproteobacteria bacterium]|nr:cupin domain-containing protein [Gammaproteobacteria bacterium]
MDSLNPVNFAEALAGVTEHWSPRVVGRVNDQYVKVAKVKGQLVWHKHNHEDEMFLVVYGRLKIELKDRTVELGPGDFYVIPKDTLHNPVAEVECGLVLIETVTTRHTGDVADARSKTIEQQLAD